MAIKSIRNILKFLGCLVCMKYVSAAVPANRAMTINKPQYSTDSISKNNSVCLTDDVVYNNRDIVPGAGLCEQCICNAPEIVCSVIKCEVKNGCKIIQKQNQCCPNYKCDCEYNGRAYNNGEKIDTSDMPCRVCYCKGGDVMCNTVGCYERDDCVGKFLPGTCCPKYDHCPPLDISTIKPTTLNIVTTRTGKGRLQPWSLITDADGTVNPIHELSTLNDDSELSTENVQSPENVFTGNPNGVNNTINESSSLTVSGSTIPLAITIANFFSREENKVKKAEDIMVTATSVNEKVSNSTADAAKEAVNTIKVTTKSIANEANPFTESTMISYHKEPMKDSHTTASFKCIYTRPVTKDDITTIPFSNSKATDESAAPLEQFGNEASSSTYVDVEKSTIDIVERLLDAKTTIQGLATEVPQMTGTIKAGEGTKYESKSDSVTEFMIASNVENNLTIRATVLLVENENQTSAVHDDAAIANVTLFQKNLNLRTASVATIAPESTNAENKILLSTNSSTTPEDSQQSLKITLTGNENKTVSVQQLGTTATSVRLVDPNSTNVTLTFSNSSVVEKGAVGSPGTAPIVLEQNSNQSTPNSNDTESLLSVDQTEVAEVILVAKNASGGDLWEEAGKINARVTVTENKNNTNSSWESSESDENYGKTTVANYNGFESDSSESKETQTSQIEFSVNETSQGKLSQILKNETLGISFTTIKSDERRKSENASEGDHHSNSGLIQNEVTSSNSSASVNSVPSFLVREATPVFHLTTNSIEYVTDIILANIEKESSTNETVKESATSQNYATTGKVESTSNATFSEFGNTIQNDSSKINSNLTRSSIPSILQSTLFQSELLDRQSLADHAKNISKDPTMTLIKSNSGNEGESSSTTNPTNETAPVVIINVSSNSTISGSESEKYAIFYKADESIISDAVTSQAATQSECVKQDNISQGATKDTVTINAGNIGQSLNNSKTETTGSKSGTITEFSTTELVTSSIWKGSEALPQKLPSSVPPNQNITNLDENSTPIMVVPTETEIFQTFSGEVFENNSSELRTTISSAILIPSTSNRSVINKNNSTLYLKIAELTENTTEYNTNCANATTHELTTESNFTMIYSQKFVAHPVKLINTINSVYMSPGLGFFENPLNKTESNTFARWENCTTENVSSSNTSPPDHVTSKQEDRKSNDSPWRNISLTNYKILLDSLIDGKVKPITRVPNVTIIPLSWLKGSAVNTVTEKSTAEATTGSTILVSGRSNEQSNMTETTIANDVTSESNESLKNESREQPAQTKVYDPLMPYPEEYPEEYQTIQNGPSLIITRTTYTRIPDVTYTTVTMVTLPTYQQVEKAEEGFADTLFDRKFHERSFPNDNTKDSSSNTGSSDSARGNSYFNIDVTKIEEKNKENVSDKLAGNGKSLKKENQKSDLPRKTIGSKSEDSNMPMLDEKDMKIVQNFMNKNLRLH